MWSKSSLRGGESDGLERRKAIQTSRNGPKIDGLDSGVGAFVWVVTPKIGSRGYLSQPPRLQGMMAEWQTLRT